MITVALIFLPLVAALMMLFVPRERAELTAFYAALVELGLFAYAATEYSTHQSAMFFEKAWLPFGAHFAVGMDGISLLLVMLTVVLMPFIITASSKGYYSSRFYSLVFLMQSALVGVFTAADGFLFYVFWELALIPIYFICLVWGGENRGRITFKFFVYTLAGSLVMLAALLYVYFQTPNQSFLITDLYKAGQQMSRTEQGWVFWAMFIAFAIKMPVFPFHTWQPDTYTTAPTAGTMLLSGIMLKMGTFGLIRWLMPLVPKGWDSWAWTAMVLSIIGIVYASCIAIVQKDYKRLIAYSSIAHVGLISAGILAFNTEGVSGALMQMVAHGINVVGLFYIAEILLERTKTREIAALGGIRGVAPQFALLFLIIVLGSVALPLTNGFVGEFLLINGVYQYNFWMAVFAGLTVILGAVYMLRSYQTIMLGETTALTESFRDLDTHEKTVLFGIAALVIFLGVFPKPLLDIAQPAVEELMRVFQEGLIG
jgi:NADH-quinone oxidoreductase subunit M